MKFKSSFGKWLRSEGGCGRFEARRGDALEPERSQTDQSLAALFIPFAIGSIRLENRVVMSPMGRAHARDGVPDPAYRTYFARRVRGGTRLVLSGAAAIGHPLADYDGTGPVFHGRAALGGWRDIAEAVHEAGGWFCPQLWHTGMARRAEAFADPAALGPSGLSVADIAAGRDPGGSAMTRRDMDAVRDAFARAADDARTIGCDAIEIHAGHGFLLDQFLWAATNRRQDEYGGSPANRARFPAEVVAACRAAVGPDFPILMRISQFKIDAYDARIANDADELGALLRPLTEAGVSLFDCSQRMIDRPAFGDDGPSLAGWVRRLTGCPVMALGSLGVARPFREDEAADPRLAVPTVSLAPVEAAARMIAAGECDLVAAGRALLADPDWTAKLRDGATAAILPPTIDSMIALC
ncbi:MAG: 12-oxophytodienoate reductase [Sphingomonadales bacterium]|nr:12-oxophytodienoate reductase [Sphingomonadales bacterium]